MVHDDIMVTITEIIGLCYVLVRLYNILNITLSICVFVTFLTSCRIFICKNSSIVQYIFYTTLVLQDMQETTALVSE